MGQNFDDYPGFQQIPGMPILLQQVLWHNCRKFQPETLQIQASNLGIFQTV